jgi:hypothetical protein
MSSPLLQTTPQSAYFPKRSSILENSSFAVMELPVVTHKDCRIHVKKPIAPPSGFFALEQLAGLLKKNQGPFNETSARSCVQVSRIKSPRISSRFLLVLRQDISSL